MWQSQRSPQFQASSFISSYDIVHYMVSKSFSLPLFLFSPILKPLFLFTCPGIYLVHVSFLLFTIHKSLPPFNIVYHYCKFFYSWQRLSYLSFHLSLSKQDVYKRQVYILLVCFISFQTTLKHTIILYILIYRPHFLYFVRPMLTMGVLILQYVTFLFYHKPMLCVCVCVCVRASM